MLPLMNLVGDAAPGIVVVQEEFDEGNKVLLIIGEPDDADIIDPLVLR